MVLIMTMTPLHMTEHGHGLGAVGHRASARTRFGMFALSPDLGPADRPVRQRCRDPRRARGPCAVAGVLAAVAPAEGGVVLFVALFLLGYGWNLGFVAGSRCSAQRPRPRRADPPPGPRPTP